ncbi:hypothetical protein M8756_14935 [Lutimaribacter sp. EGI FJ00015]|uniref:Uncharacterized protein n=1 Tax=Lutimaribacter degradans TaxID=2945989 RepID=A0ACC5ZZU0_9RHOB|nr:hypothetical protein [Lutimaribacter sp. EGI FJ00013]MCM2563433.1 hypothetical protein [Lutimaribacter sp. EGI FJ00013]MCO0614613.1 hypothetical protein [Lutimaribacter sp. EGI FJ00015]MCO0637284.1 hypothetical protein [Lutimaribacter sp. EGI FJ00014]
MSTQTTTKTPAKAALEALEQAFAYYAYTGPQPQPKPVPRDDYYEYVADAA